MGRSSNRLWRRRELLTTMGGMLLGWGIGGLSGCLPRAISPSPLESPASAPGLQPGRPLRIGYLPITDASPLLAAEALGFYREEGLGSTELRLFRSWAQLMEAFQARQVDVIHLLMPAAIWLRYSRRFPARVVAWNHVNGSAFTVRPEIHRLEDLGGQTVAVPFWYSIHNVILQMLLRKAGLKPVLGGEGKLGEDEVRLIVLPPPEMPPALASGRIAGFVVAEPFNALAEVQQVGRVLRFTGDVWREHACCVVVMHEADLEQAPSWAQGVIRAVVRAQIWLRQNRQEAARLLSREGKAYLPHPPEVLERVFAAHMSEYEDILQHPEWSPRRIDFQPYPYPSFTEALVSALRNTEVEGEKEFLGALDPAHAARDLVLEDLVRRAIEEVGGPEVFGQPVTWSRQEQIEP
jgi:NitT/TauT family transport system substrate-binding protein